MTDKTDAIQKLIGKNETVIEALESDLEKKEERYTVAGVENALRVTRDRQALGKLRAEVGELEDYDKAGIADDVEQKRLLAAKEELEAKESEAFQADAQWARRHERHLHETRSLREQIEDYKAKGKRLREQLDRLLSPVVEVVSTTSELGS